MTQKWNDLKHKLPLKKQAEIREEAKGISAEMKLSDVRAARQFTQLALAETLGTSQAAVSKIESRADLYISTLRNYLEAMGGRLEIRAVFPDGEVRIERFGN